MGKVYRIVKSRVGTAASSAAVVGLGRRAHTMANHGQLLFTGAVEPMHRTVKGPVYREGFELCSRPRPGCANRYLKLRPARRFTGSYK